MITDTEAYAPVHANGFTVLQHKGHVIITQAKGYKYLLENEILFQCNLGESFLHQNLFKALLGKDGLPSKFAEYAASRSRDLRGEILHIYASAEPPMHFCESEKFAAYYGIVSPSPVKLTVTETFGDEEEFRESFADDSLEAFGFWDIEKDEICASLLWSHPMQAAMCFTDFGKRRLSIGSLFLKFEIEKANQ